MVTRETRPVQWPAEGTDGGLSEAEAWGEGASVQEGGPLDSGNAGYQWSRAAKSMPLPLRAAA